MTKNKSNPNKINYFKYFINLLGGHFYLYVFLNFLIGVLDSIGITLFIPLISLAINNNESNGVDLGRLEFIMDFIKKVGIETTLFNVLGIMVFVFCIKGIINYLKQVYFIKLRVLTIRKIRLKLIHKFRHLSYIGYTNYNVGKIQNTMISETQRFVDAMVVFFQSVQHVIMLLVYMTFAFLANWQFSILIGLGGLLTNLIYRVINNKIKIESKNWTLVGEEFNKHLIEAIYNFKYLKATNYFSIYQKNLITDINNQEKVQFRLGNLRSIAESLREPLIVVVISVVLLLQVEFIGERSGSLIISLAIFYRALGFLTKLQETWIRFLSNVYSLTSIEMLFKEFDALTELKQSKDTIEYIGNINLKNLNVTLGGKKILRDINVTIPKFSTIALVGESGAGKSTLANVISGLIPQTKGHISIQNNKIHLSKEILNSYRENIGYISQEPVIFDDTLYNNISFWQPKNDENLKKFNDVIKLVSLENFLTNLPDGLDEPLGHSGVLVSGGQKQRISIARELFKNPELLIFDEATSALDTETENLIKQNLEKLHGKYTMVIIAHRLSTIKHADVVYLMKNGRIENQGSFSELYDKSEGFRKMVNLQEF